MCVPLIYTPAPVPNFVVIPPKLTNPSGLSWRVPNFNIRNRIQ